MTFYALKISIHAPLTGCDSAIDASLGFLKIFQSTHPLRDATVSASELISKQQISIHAPLTGCDSEYKEPIKLSKVISIHAPLTGCDKDVLIRETMMLDFNPRTPYGMRL